MQTLTLQYDANIVLIKSILNSAILAGAKVVTPENDAEGSSNVLTAYQRIFGQRKGNKYTDNEVFVFNSLLNTQKILEKYED